MKCNHVSIDDVLYHKTIQAINPYNLGRFNKSTYFLLPMLESYIGNNKLLNNLLVNVYLDDKDHDNEYTRPLFLLFKMQSFTDPDWLAIQKIFKIKEPFVDLYLNEYYVGTEKKDGIFHHLYMFVFATPLKRKEDYYHFKMGRYSQFSDEYKRRFPKEAISGGKIVESKIYGAIHKTTNLKEYLIKEFNVNKKEEDNFRQVINECDELWDKPKPEEEYFNYKK